MLIFFDGVEEIPGGFRLEVKGVEWCVSLDEGLKSELSDAGDHGGVIGAEFKRWDGESEVISRAIVFESLTESFIGGDAAGDDDGCGADQFGGAECFTGE